MTNIMIIPSDVMITVLKYLDYRFIYVNLWNVSHKFRKYIEYHQKLHSQNEDHRLFTLLYLKYKYVYDSIFTRIKCGKCDACTTSIDTVEAYDNCAKKKEVCRCKTFVCDSCTKVGTRNALHICTICNKKICIFCNVNKFTKIPMCHRCKKINDEWFNESSDEYFTDDDDDENYKVY